MDSICIIIHILHAQNSENFMFFQNPKLKGQNSFFSFLATLAVTILFYLISSLPLMLYTLQRGRSEEHTPELQSRGHLVCRPLLAKRNEDSRVRRHRRPKRRHS